MDLERRARGFIGSTFAAAVFVTCGADDVGDDEKPATDDDTLASAVVQVVSGDRTLAGAAIPSTDPNCTGVLVSPLLVLTASHCFGTGAPKEPTRGVFGGDTACAVRDAGGAVVAAGGCGSVLFTDVHGNVHEAQRVRRVFVSHAVAWNNTRTDHAGDLALVFLDHRATARTRARATPVPPWLDDDLDAAAWAGRPTRYYGWGRVGPVSGAADECDLTGRGASTELRYWDEAPLDPVTPVASAPITGTDQGGLMFAQRFEAFGDANGWLLPGDSGGPLLVTTAGGARVIGVASMQACDKHVGCTGGKAGTLENLWARSMDARSGNVAMLRALAQNPDGSLWGDDVATSGCDATPPEADPEDPDCDRVLTSPQAWQPRDNCPNVYNPDQRDADGDGVGDACEASTFRGDP